MINKIRLFFILMILLLLANNSQPVKAQDYYFEVENETMEVFVNEDGSLTIDYVFDFKNNVGAHPIDIVDIGLPNNNYVLSSITAEINGNPITDIKKSDYIDVGIMVNLGSYAIQSGKSGTLHVNIATVNKSLYPSKAQKDEDYASFEISPSWFGSEFISGDTDLTVTLYMPLGIGNDEAVYHTPKGWKGEKEPVSGLDNMGGIFYQWHNPQANAYTQYTFGASFPARVVPKSQIVKRPSITFDNDAICSSLICLGIGGFFISIKILSTISEKKRKLKYLPPKISIEGHGIRRGLTAVEAAILMEQPLEKVMTMILFSLLKKGAAEVVTKKPLKVKASLPKPDNLQAYEEEFLTAIQLDKEKKKALQDMMIKLVKTVSNKMKGFSRKETIDYYRSIIEKAWNQVETAQTPEIKSEFYEQNMDWTMLDKKYDDRTRDTFGSGPVIIPTWWWRYDPGFRPSTSIPTSSTSSPTPSFTGSGKTTINLPVLPGADFAASITNGVQNFANNVIGDVTSFTGSITNKTNPVPVSSSSGRSSSGGGGSCACACACAGCACACAGGGR